jgi:hypothetical protein
LPVCTTVHIPRTDVREVCAHDAWDGLLEGAWGMIHHGSGRHFHFLVCKRICGPHVRGHLKLTHLGHQKLTHPKPMSAGRGRSARIG